MTLFMDMATTGGPATNDGVEKAHAADLHTPRRIRLLSLRYRADQEHGKILFLVDAPDADAAVAVRREAHGLAVDETYPVAEGA